MDNPPPSSASRPAGYTAIALASAAGVIAASRMGRPALVLAAGLALAWWKKHKQQAHQAPRPKTPEVHRPAPVVTEPVMVTEPVIPEAPVTEQTLAPIMPPPAELWRPLVAEGPTAPESGPELVSAPTFAEPSWQPAFSPPAEVALEAPPTPSTEPFSTFEPPPPSPPVLEPEPPADTTPSWLPAMAFASPPPPPPVVEPKPLPPAPSWMSGLALETPAQGRPSEPPASWMPAAAFGAPSAPLPSAPPPAPPTTPLDHAPLLAFPIAPTRSEAPLADAWNDLRAALNPSLHGKGPKLGEPLPPLPDMHEEPAPAPASLPQIEAPEMPDMYVFPPSSPLLDSLGEDEPLPAFPSADEAPTVPLTYLKVPAMPDMNFSPPSWPMIDEADEGVSQAQPSHPPPPSSDSLHFFPQPPLEPVGEIPDEIHLPGMTEEETAAAMAESGFLVTDPPVDAEPTMPQFVHAFAPPVIAPAAASTPESASTPTQSGNPLTAPVVLPREAQVKKSFFDWLRS